MDRDDKTRIRANLTDLRTIPVEELSDALYQEGVLDDDDLDSLKINKAPREISSDLFRAVIRKGKRRHYAILCGVLESAGYAHFVDQLQDTDLSKHDYNFDASPAMKMQTLYQQLKETQEDIFEENDYLKSANEDLKDELSELKIVADREARLRQSKSEMDPNIVAYINQCITGNNPTDNVDSGIKSLTSFIPQYVQEWMNLRNPVMNANATEQIARQLGADIVSYKCMSNPPPAMTTYAVKMRSIVDEILIIYEGSFMKFMDVLYLDEINGLQTLWNIAEQVFADFKEGEKPNWGHVATLYAFGAYMAKHSFTGDAAPQMANFVGDFLGYYVSKKLGTTIVKCGGWEGFLRHFDRNVSLDFSNMLRFFFSLSIWFSNIIYSNPGNEC